MGSMLLTPPHLCLFVCENLRADAEAAVKAQGLADIEIRTFPARCGQPPLGRDEVAALVKESRPNFAEIIGSRCLGPNIYISGSRIRRAAECVHFLCSPTLADALQQSSAGLLLPRWLVNWQEHFVGGGEQFFKRPVNRLILLDTGTDAQVEKRLAELAAYLELPAERLPVGLEYHGLLLAKIAAEHKEEELARQQEQAHQQAAQAAMTFDLLGLVVKANSEPEVLAGIAELFTMLFAPRQVRCLPVTKKGLAAERLIELTVEERVAAEEFHAKPDRQYELTAAGDSFFLRIGSGEQSAAIVLVEQIAFPQHIHSYLNTALHVSGVCALAVEHVRILKKLLDTSRLAGKAEVATEVLHNVGNTLNSISVSAERIGEMVQKSGSATLPAIVQLIEAHRDNLASFFTSNPKGRKLPLYFSSLAAQLAKEQWRLMEEIGHQLRHIRRAAEIIRTQQDAARGKALIEQFDLAAVIEESLEIFEPKIAERRIIVQRSYARLPVMEGQRHKILQVAGNLISNAADSFDGMAQEGRKIMLRLRLADTNMAVLEVEDNGKGISSAIIEQIFAFGFTAKKDGHGFGLHNAANLTAEMGGTLTVESQGEGKGALFRLELPLTAVRRGYETKGLH